MHDEGSRRSHDGDETTDQGSVGSAIGFETLPEEPGLAIHDRVKRRRYVLGTADAVQPTSVAEDRIRYPVDAAVRITTGAVCLDQIVWASVRDGDGNEVVSVTPNSSHDLPPASYEVELNAPMKLYLQVDGGMTVQAGVSDVHFEFDGSSELVVGARSFHDRPATTLTTPPDPESMMDVVSWFGSSLKTTSCERSYPTLRGHPPTVELGDSVTVPSGLTRPDTGVTLTVPPTHRGVYVAAPLAFYLGARLEPGTPPRLETDRGFVHDLDTEHGFAGEIERILKQAFLLDCVVRTEGYYQIDLHERTVLDDVLDVDLAALYDEPLAAQLEAYLSIPFDEIAPHVPQWALTAHLAPEPERIEGLPFVVDELAVVRAHTPSPASRDDARAAALSEFLSDDGSGATANDGAGADRAVVRGDDDRDDAEVIQLPETDAMETAWFGEGIPVDGTKASVQAYRNGLDREPTDGPIGITVVCNDSEMAEEYDVVRDVYGSRDELPFDVTFHAGVDADRLRRILAEDTDFLHYIGHISSAGFECTDGTLDAADLDSVGVDVFLLNACRSYEQGVHLVEAGSIGGIVTLSDVINTGAVAFGHALARLLNVGFPLHAAIYVARKRSVVGGHYVVVGDGSADVAQNENAAPTLCRVSTTADDEYELTVRAYLGSDGGMGTFAYPWLESNKEHFLVPGDMGPIRVSESELREFLTWTAAPVEIDGQLHWQDATDLEALTDDLQ